MNLLFFYLQRNSRGIVILNTGHYLTSHPTDIYLERWRHKFIDHVTQQVRFRRQLIARLPLWLVIVTCTNAERRFLSWSLSPVSSNGGLSVWLVFTFLIKLLTVPSEIIWLYMRCQRRTEHVGLDSEPRTLEHILGFFLITPLQSDTRYATLFCV